MLREVKALPTYIKSVDGRSVTGIFSVFGNKDSYDDVIQPGFFKDVFSGPLDNLVYLWQHNADEPPVATITDYGELTRAELPSTVLAKAPEATGGAYVTRTYLDTPRGNELLAGIKAGAIKQMSFAFTLAEDGYSYSAATKDTARVRNLTKCQELYDISDVNWGANFATVAAKSNRQKLEAAKRVLKAWVAGGGLNGLDLAVVNGLMGGLQTIIDEGGADVGTINDVLDAVSLLWSALYGLRDQARDASGGYDGYYYWSNVPQGERKALRDGLITLLDGRKSGARHSKADQEIIENLHAFTVDLGAKCPIGEAGEQEESDETAKNRRAGLERRARALRLVLPS